ncbi:MAG: hypothetical protein DMG10_22945 [Acidobacteria bacterium]|nr:MAG: hypothetical protein DMG10_22945 [Acidobacteriota bacterium]
MPLKRRGKWYHLSEKVNGVKIREALGTKDHRLAKRLYKERIAELMRSNPDPSKVARGYTKMTIAEAVEAYANERRKKAWQKIRAKAGLGNFRFYDGRHTVITTLQEKGVPDWVIQAQVGHVSAEEAKPYSHIRRKALDQVALLLKPVWSTATKWRTGVMCSRQLVHKLVHKVATCRAKLLILLKGEWWAPQDSNL